jgi:hypothetical protein
LERMEGELSEAGIVLFPPINRSTSFDQGMDRRLPTLVFAPHTPGAQVYSYVAEALLGRA